ncbi:hypothetical protein OC834_007594, partial [Tilletia horrida]
MQFKALSIALSLAIGLTSVMATSAPIIRPRSLIPYTPGDLATHDARVARRDIHEARGLTKRCKSQPRDGSGSASSAPLGGSVHLSLEDQKPMVPRVMMPIQFGSENVTLYTYLAGLNPDCIAFNKYDPSKSTSAVR